MQITKIICGAIWLLAAASLNVWSSDNNATASVADFFRASPYDHIRMNHDGRYVAYSESLDDKYHVSLYDTKANKHYLVYTAERYTTETIKKEHYVKWVEHNNRIRGITWLGESVLGLREYTKDGFRRYIILKLDIEDDQIELDDESYLNQNGYWLNPLIKRDRYAIFAKYKANDEIDYHVDLFKLDLKKSNLDGQTSNKKRLNQRGPKLQYWLTEENGVRTVGTRRIDDQPELFARSGSSARNYRWNSVWKGNKKDYFSLEWLDIDNNMLYVTTNHNSDKKQLRQFDLSSNRFVKTVFAHEKYDVRGAIVSSDNKRLLGASYIEHGYVKQHFLDGENPLKQLSNVEEFANKNLYLVTNAENAGISLVEASSSNDPGKYLVFNHNTNSFNTMFELRPWLSEITLQSSTMLKVKSTDNIEVEAFLTLPAKNASQKVPLLVIPHGGPIGVSDLRYYSPEIQVLVNAGYATLQVNYRGSEGYGKAFKNKGMKQWGQGIEDDIEQALQQTVEANPSIDAQRVCIVGGSYGGYSAIYSVIRSPELYQCAASFAGVTDLALLFQRSDVENDDKVQKQLREIVGNPSTEQTQLFEASPVYQAKNISKPLFIAHGTDDEIVDIEHAYRLRFALKKHDIPFKWQVLDGVAHGFETTQQAETYYSALLLFLAEHLTQAEG